MCDTMECRRVWEIHEVRSEKPGRVHREVPQVREAIERINNDAELRKAVASPV